MKPPTPKNVVVRNFCDTTQCILNMLMPLAQAAALHGACFLPTATVRIALRELVLRPEQLVQTVMETTPNPCEVLVPVALLPRLLAMMRHMPLIVAHVPRLRFTAAGRSTTAPTAPPASSTTSATCAAPAGSTSLTRRTTRPSRPRRRCCSARLGGGAF